MSDSGPTGLPLFYRKPELLHAEQHAELRVGSAGYDFAAETNALPLAVIEFGQAMRHYPIVFAKDGFPVAILGLDRANRFVADGEWAARTYIPAYVRRYPFIFAGQGGDSFALAIDRMADHLVAGGEDGMALFADGKPTETVTNIMAFCRDFQGAHIQTQAFAAELVAQALLIDRQADAKLDSGRSMMLSGFKVVDRTKFDALQDETILAWHRKGWLALLHFHFLSLDRFADLLDLEAMASDQTDQAMLAETAV